MLSFKSKTAILLLAAMLLWGCGKDSSDGQEKQADRVLTVLFSPGGVFSGAGYDDTILKAVMESAARSQNFDFRLKRPSTQAEARSLAASWQERAGAQDALLLCGPQYEELGESLTPKEGRVLLIDCDKSLEGGVATLQLKRYGGAYLAGVLSYPFKLLLIKALDGDRMLDTVADGIEEGYKAAGGTECERLVLSDSYEGMNMADGLFNLLFEMVPTYETCLVPICGASRAGAYALSRNMWVTALGIGEDCSAYSEVLPYSLVYDLGAIVKDYLDLWLREEPWPAHADFGLSTGHVSIVYNPRFFEEKIGLAYEYKLLMEDYRQLEAQYKNTALEKEASHAY